MANRPGTRLRGYGSPHQKLRAKWKLKVDRGEVHCARCGKSIEPGTPWDLGHDDQDRKFYKGPEHAKCNRGAPRKGRQFRTRIDAGPSREW